MYLHSSETLSCFYGPMTITDKKYNPSELKPIVETLENIFLSYYI